MPQQTQDTQESLIFQLDLLHLFAANRASGETLQREAGRLEDMLARLEQSN